MKLEEVQERLALLKRATEGIKIEVKEYCQDTSKPLEDRWDLFINSELGDEERFYEDFGCSIGRDAVEQCEDKYSLQRVEDVLESNEYEDDNPEVSIYKEAVLAKFIKSWQYDW